MVNVKEIALRMGVVAKVVCNIRERLTRGERYSGVWAPNLQSALDVMHIPIKYVKQAVAERPELGPTEEEMTELVTFLETETTDDVGET